MILDVLVFMLGFLVAGLLALAALPAIWRRALRLSGERLARLVPLSAEEITAERDHLRAVHAVDLRRTEQKLERAEADRATLMAEASRLKDRIAALDRANAAAAAEITTLGAEATRLQRELNELWAEVGASAIALNAATDLAERRWMETVDLRLERERLAGQIDQDRASVAALETRLLGETTRADDLARDLERARRGPLPAAPGDGTPATGRPLPDRDALVAAIAARDHDIDHLTAELAFMNEQAASAERRAKDAIVAYEKLAAERAAAAAMPGAAPGSEFERLRAAIDALADQILKATGNVERTGASETV